MISQFGFHTGVVKADEQCRVAALARVSTLHEAQMNALANQEQWLCDLISQHPNWIFDPSKDLFTDEGKTGTTQKGRDGLKELLERAMNKEYDLIIIREVSRLMRCTKDILTIVDDLRLRDVEVYFAAENISSFESSKRFELELRASLAQQESEKLGRRVKAGLQVTKTNGIITSGMNVYGYDYVPKGKNVSGLLVPNEEEAKVVQKIFDMCAKGYGLKQIGMTLKAEGVKDRTGSTNWLPSRLSRILHKRVYYGVLEYNQTETIDAILKARKKKDKSEHTLIRSPYITPLITEETYNKAIKYLVSRTHKNLLGGKDMGGFKLTNDVYVQLIRCECGRRYRRNPGRNNTAVYACNDVWDNGSVNERLKIGGTSEGVCTLPGIIDWKLDLYTKKIFESLSIDLEGIKQSLRDCIEECYTDENAYTKAKKRIMEIDRKLEKLERDIGVLVEKLVDSPELADVYEKSMLAKKEEIKKLKLEKEELDKVEDNLNAKEQCLKEVDEFLTENLCLEDTKIPDVIIRTYVNSIKIYNNNTFEYNIRVSETADTINMTEHNADWSAQKKDAILKIDNSNAVVLTEIQVSTEEARQYARSRGRKLNTLRWSIPTLKAVANI